MVSTTHALRHARDSDRVLPRHRSDAPLQPSNWTCPLTAGEIEYELDDDVNQALICYCKTCQRSSSSQ